MEQITFTEKEVNDLAGFINFVYTKAIFNNLRPKDVQQFNSMLNNMHGHLSKCEKHIMELIEVKDAPKKGKK